MTFHPTGRSPDPGCMYRPNARLASLGELDLHPVCEIDRVAIRDVVDSPVLSKIRTACEPPVATGTARAHPQLRPAGATRLDFPMRSPAAEDSTRAWSLADPSRDSRVVVLQARQARRTGVAVRPPPPERSGACRSPSRSLDKGLGPSENRSSYNDRESLPAACDFSSREGIAVAATQGNTGQYVDMVCEGSGVRGIGLAGAYQ